MTTIISLLTTTALTIGTSPTTDSEPLNDLQRLQGSWIAQAGPDRTIQVEMEIEGNRVRVAIATPQGLRFRVQGELALDESTRPPSLDWLRFNSFDGQALPEVPAIYRLDGTTWTICNGSPHGARPSEFRPGDGLIADVITFRRPVAGNESLAAQSR